MLEEVVEFSFGLGVWGKADRKRTARERDIWMGAQGFRGSHRSINYYLWGEPGSLRFRGRRLFEMRLKKMFAK
jgi:hypothetical protein